MIPATIPNSAHLPFSNFAPLKLFQAITKQRDSHKWLVQVTKEDKSIATFNFENWEFTHYFCQSLYLNICLAPEAYTHNYIFIVTKFSKENFTVKTPKIVAVSHLVGLTLNEVPKEVLISNASQAIKHSAHTEFSTLEALLPTFNNVSAGLDFIQQELPHEQEGFDAVAELVTPWIANVFERLSISKGPLKDTDSTQEEFQEICVRQFSSKLGKLFYEWVQIVSEHPPLKGVTWARDPSETGIIEYFSSVSDWAENLDGIYSLSEQGFPVIEPKKLITSLILALWFYEHQSPQKLIGYLNSPSKSKIPAAIRNEADSLTNELLKSFSNLECAYLFSAGCKNKQDEEAAAHADDISSLPLLTQAQDVCNTFFPEFKDKKISVRHAFWDAWSARSVYLTQEDLEAIAEVGLPLYFSGPGVELLKDWAMDLALTREEEAEVSVLTEEAPGVT